MPSKNGKNTVFVLTRDDVVDMVRQVDPNIDPEKAVDEDMLAHVKKGVESGLGEAWPVVMRVAVEDALPNTCRQQSMKFQ